jgi:hypothetical protein
MYSPYKNSTVREEVNEAKNIKLAKITAIRALLLGAEDSGMLHNNER